ncbi:DUF4402 domain-containing protein [Sneathiella marina]|uniref:DUF4402 domain-containing protein n=1 Tax=Sneathiella marina TaxID=2950108 RepID=A0ABY4W1L8_9PROT|nr:DUF4402 domain-containing protein [Sneathiella marina]USG59747.1 DUF4402 domain-containing protein [Sneathiella marina]
MNKHLRNIGLCAMGLIIASPAFAEDAETLATVKVVVPIEITHHTDLSFGKIAAGGAAGSVTLLAGLSGSSTITSVPTSITVTGSPGPARFTVYGSKGASVGLSASTTGLSNGNGDKLTVEDFNFESFQSSDGTSVTGTPVNLDANGRLGVNMGATLTIPDGSPYGDYSGNVTFSVTYN